MLVFETILGLLFAATMLSIVARRVNVPYTCCDRIASR